MPLFMHTSPSVVSFLLFDVFSKLILSYPSIRVLQGNLLTIQGLLGVMLGDVESRLEQQVNQAFMGVAHAKVSEVYVYHCLLQVHLYHMST